MVCSECGRPAVARSTRRKSCRLSRKKHPHAIADHCLCSQCFERQTDAHFAWMMRGKHRRVPSE